MERGKIKVDDKNIDKALDHVYQNALGNPIILKEVPTKDNMKANTLGKFGTDVYIKTGDGTLLKITGVEV